MYLTSLVYASEMSGDFGPKDVEQIIATSQKNNTKRNVTGTLIFNSNYFLQCLEGSRKEVNALYLKILHDKRHENIILLDYKELVKRQFTNWSMGYIPDTLMTREDILEFGGKDYFNPYEMKGESARGLLVKLSQKLPVLT